MFSKLEIIACLFIFLITTTAKAGLIVDTGPGGPSGWSLIPSQSLAGEFSINNDTFITAVEAYIQAFDESQTATTSIYSDGGDIPGSLLYSSKFALEPRPPSQDWQGAHDLNWFLNASTYWVVFSVEDDDTYTSSGWITRDAENPLENYAFTRSDTGAWTGNDDLNLALRIVPEPTSLSIFILGLVGIVVLGRKRKFRL